MDIGTRVRITRTGEIIGHLSPRNRLDGSIDPTRPSLVVDIGGLGTAVLRLAPVDVEPLAGPGARFGTDVVMLADIGELRRAIRYALVADEGLQWLRSYAAGEPGAWEELNAWDGRTDRPKPTTIRDMTHG